MFEQFECPSEADPLPFSQLCAYHYSEAKTVCLEAVNMNIKGDIIVL